MSKILTLVKEEFLTDTFTVREFEKKTGVDFKVAAMNLAKLANSHKLGRFRGDDGTPFYFYVTVEMCNKKRKEANALIEKYGLKQKLFLMVKPETFSF